MGRNGSRTGFRQASLQNDYWFNPSSFFQCFDKTSTVFDSLNVGTDYLGFGVLGEILHEIRAVKVAAVAVTHQLTETKATN